jgi:hypothetical protein
MTVIFVKNALAYVPLLVQEIGNVNLLKEILILKKNLTAIIACGLGVLDILLLIKSA